MARQFESDAKRRELIKEIKKYIADGLSAQEASKKVGIHYSTYCAWNKKFEQSSPIEKKKRAKPYVEQINVEPSPSKVACIIGTPQEISDVLKGMK